MAGLSVNPATAQPRWAGLSDGIAKKCQALHPPIAMLHAQYSTRTHLWHVKQVDGSVQGVGARDPVDMGVGGKAFPLLNPHVDRDADEVSGIGRC